MSKNYENRLLVIPFGGETHLTVVLRQDKAGNVLHATTGDCSASVTFAQGRIAATRHPQRSYRCHPSSAKRRLAGADSGDRHQDAVRHSVLCCGIRGHQRHRAGCAQCDCVHV